MSRVEFCMQFFNLFTGRRFKPRWNKRMQQSQEACKHQTKTKFERKCKMPQISLTHTGRMRDEGFKETITGLCGFRGSSVL